MYYVFHILVNIGEPHLPVSFGGRGRSSILPSNVETVAGDHDFHVDNFTPSVCLHVDIKPDEGQDMISYYRVKSCFLYLSFQSIVYKLLLFILQARHMYG